MMQEDTTQKTKVENTYVTMLTIHTKTTGREEISTESWPQLEARLKEDVLLVPASVEPMDKGILQLAPIQPFLINE